MALAKKCDRCGALYEYYEKPSPDKSGRYNGVRLTGWGEVGEPFSRGKNWDLCPHCLDLFFGWILNVDLTTKEET